MKHFGNEFDNNTSNPRSMNTINSSRSSNRITSTTTTGDTRPGVFSNPLEAENTLHVIGMEYNNILGPMNMQIARYIEQLLREGMEPEVILDALQSTAWARRPSPQYFRAICARYRERGIMTMGAVLHDQDEWESRQKPWWIVQEPPLPF